MSERWAFCDRCQRWFYMQPRGVEHGDTCPVCDTTPSMISDRAPDTTRAAS